MSQRSSIGVGFIGAGMVVQSIHLPTLATLGDRFHVAVVWDIDSELAGRVAVRCGARASEDLADLLADPAVEVVAVCSPAAFHADHVIAAIEAGKRAVLVEKPFATSREEAARIADAAGASGTPVLVGAMHLFDPGWHAVAEEAVAIAAEADLIRSRIVLPFNSRFEAWAFEPVERPAPAQPSAPPPPTPEERRIAVLTGGLLQLAIHDVPLIRALLREGAKPEVTSVDTFAPFGYAITARVGTQLLDLFAHVGDHWQARWSLEAQGASSSVTLDFPPSFVAAGAIEASTERDGVVTRRAKLVGNGYEGEWCTIAAILEGDAGTSIPPVATLADDLGFALDLLDQAKALANGREAGA